MVTIAKLTADLVANTSQFETAFKRSDNLVGDFSKSVKRSLAEVTSQFTSFNSLIATAVGGAGIGALAKSALDTADHVDKLSQQLGLSAAQFQRYQFGAQLGGVATEEFEKAIGFLNNQIAEGKVPYKNTGDAILAIAERMKNASSAIDRAGIATENFGSKSGRVMIPFLIQGKQRVQELGDEAERLGLVFGGQLISDASELKDQLSLIGTVIKSNFQAGLLERFVGESKTLHDIYTDPKFAESAKAIGESLGTFLKYVVEHGREIQAVLTVLAGLKFGGVIGGLAGAGIAANNYLDTMTPKLEVVNAELDIWQANVDNLNKNNIKGKPLDDAIAKVKELTALQAKLGFVGPPMPDGLQRNAKSPKDSGNGKFDSYADSVLRAKNIKTINDELDTENATIVAQIENYGKKKEAIAAAVEEAKVESQLRAKGITLSDKEREQLEARIAVMQQNAAELDKLKEAAQQADEAGKELGSTLGDAFHDAITGAKDFKGILKSVGDDILKMLIKIEFEDPIAKGFSGILKNSGGLGSLFSSFLPSFAVGTPYVPHDMIAQIHQGERIVPASENNGWGGGGGVSIQVQNNAGASVTATASESGSGTDINIMIDKAVADNIARRGTKTNAALGAYNSQGLTRR